MTPSEKKGKGLHGEHSKYPCCFLWSFEQLFPRLVCKVCFMFPQSNQKVKGVALSEAAPRRNFFQISFVGWISVSDTVR